MFITSPAWLFLFPRAFACIGHLSRRSFRAIHARTTQTYVDSSDPDLDLPNLVHMLQTAEGIRRAGHPDWYAHLPLAPPLSTIDSMVQQAAQVSGLH
jgi:hypothetical protein